MTINEFMNRNYLAPPDSPRKWQTHPHQKGAMKSCSDGISRTLHADEQAFLDFQPPEQIVYEHCASVLF